MPVHVSARTVLAFGEFLQTVGPEALVHRFLFPIVRRQPSIYFLLIGGSIGVN
jgi:hypothetical protein